MKRCPECRRDFYDDSLLYCLDDGSALLEGPGQVDEPATAMLHSTGASAERPTRRQVHATDQTAIFPKVDRAASPGRPALKSLAALAGVVILAAAALAAYRYLATTSSAEQLSSIAVLPFENRSGSAETDYLSDGVTDSLIFRFSQLPNLKVSPTSSVMTYKGRSADVAQIGKELDVDAVLTGRLQQIGDSISISVQLINTRTKKLIWAEQYDRKMADLLATQRDIALAITQKLQLKLTGSETGIAKKYTSSNDAYQLYLKGRFHWARRTADDLNKAIESFQQAIDIDPNFALAYVGIAYAHNSMGKDPEVAPKDCIPFAKSAATKALQIDPLLAEAHGALADTLSTYDWNWAEAEREFRRAIELDPNVSYIHVVYSSSYLNAAGRPDEAVREAERAVELEPLALINNSVLAAAYVYNRQFDKALIQAQKTVDLDPQFRFSNFWLGMALIKNGKHDQAIAIGKRTSEESPQALNPLYLLGEAYAAAGNRAEAEKVLERLHEISKTKYVRTYYLASMYAALGDKDKAFAELERSFQDHDCYLNRARVDPFMDPLRDDARFASLMKRMKLE